MLVFDASCSGSTIPNYQECLTPESKAHKFCDASLPAEDRLADLLQAGARSRCPQRRVSRCNAQGLSLSEKVALVAPDPSFGSRPGIGCIFGRRHSAFAARCVQTRELEPLFPCVRQETPAATPLPPSPLSL